MILITLTLLANAHALTLPKDSYVDPIFGPLEYEIVYWHNDLQLFQQTCYDTEVQANNGQAELWCLNTADNTWYVLCQDVEAFYPGRDGFGRYRQGQYVIECATEIFRTGFETTVSE